MKNISNVELRCNNNVDKPVSKETSISEGDSVPVDTGVSTPPSLGSFSQPSGSVSSEAPADVVASPEPPGPRKISTRKNRAARISPMEDWRTKMESRQEMIFWKLVWTWLNLEFLLSSLEILIRTLTGPWIVAGRTRSMTPMKARWPFGNFLRSVV